VAEDIVSDSIIKLWETIKTQELLNKEHLEALLITILKNKSLDYLKHEAIRYEAEEKISNDLNRELEIRISSLEACDPNDIFSKEIKQIFYHTLETMPENTRRIFTLSRLDELTNKEIADKLGISIKDVEYHISKALKYLRISLKDYLPLIAFMI
jgi:RNA polymerase sigma-70 factor (ECF subfamily)